MSFIDRSYLILVSMMPGVKLCQLKEGAQIIEIVTRTQESCFRRCSRESDLKTDFR